MQLKTCIHCGEFSNSIVSICPHCGVHKDQYQIKSNKKFTSAAILLGFALTGCGDKSEDTSSDTASSEPTSEPTNEPTQEPAVEPPYGVPDPDTGEPEESD